MKIVAADQFSLETLADAYNQTRIDYIVPMPMSVDRLKEYVRVYDVDLARSCATVEGELITGLGMLGLRPGCAWITRLGVLPAGRRKGTGRAIMEHLLQQAADIGSHEVWLEVIKGNSPAHALFRRCGFAETDELIVARRPPRYQAQPATATERAIIKDVRTVSHEGALALLESRQGHLAWTNQPESMRNARDLSGLIIELSNGERGWVTFHASLLQLSRIIVEIEAGPPEAMTATVLEVLHRLYPTQDAIAENFSAHDPRWAGFQKAGYFDAFRRVEMALFL